MSESNFIQKVGAACNKKEDLYQKSKTRYAVRSIFAGGFLTLSTAVGAVAADLLNSFVPGTGRFLFPFIFAWGLVYLLFLNAELTTSNWCFNRSFSVQSNHSLCSYRSKRIPSYCCRK